MYYRGAAAAIIVYDITRKPSFATLQNWVEELKKSGPANIAIGIAGNKADLVEKRVRYIILYMYICIYIYIIYLCIIYI